MPGLFQKKPVTFFSEEEKLVVSSAIQKAEQRTSGEIRVYIESHCREADPLTRAKDVFSRLKMEETAARNGVLVYVAMKDKKLAVYGDAGIHEKVGNEFWQSAIDQILQHFNKQNYSEGIAGIVQGIGEALATHFPYVASDDSNELPDDIVFGK